MAFGIYVHVPYCLQICPYCDFTKYEWGKTLPPEQYIELLRTEIRQRAPHISSAELDTVYFGGGTPSLLDPKHILAILDELAKQGFRRRTACEVSIEIDPATCDQMRLTAYLDAGVNRFSVGAQSFNDRLLKIAGRKHSSWETVETLALLKENEVNYSFDLLFALPTQTLADLEEDVKQALSFHPAHVSAYCLTVPEGHRLSFNRAPDEEQVEMFHLIEDELRSGGMERYEISNFARPGAESRHNLLYWTDQPYWGIGLSAHSYFPQDPSRPAVGRETPDHWGLRFWNPRAMKKYAEQLTSSSSGTSRPFVPGDQYERLKLNQALTDFCHTSLRLTRGLDENALRLKFGERRAAVVASCMQALRERTLVVKTATGWALSAAGRLIANTVFEKLTFLENEIA